MRFSVGHQNDAMLQASVLAHRDVVSEVYFAWPGMASGRTGQGEAGRPEAVTELMTALTEYARHGLQLNLLLNGNCYGRQALSRAFFSRLGDLVDSLVERVGLSSVTTTSPVAARFLRLNFPDLELRASVNMDLGTVEALEYLGGMFDSIYARRELNYNLRQLETLRAACSERGMRMLLLANSGCLNFCPARTFHDNLVAHEAEIAEMDNAFAFGGLCHTHLATAEARADYLRHSNMIRPEDVHHYEGLCDGMKLATRISRQAAVIVEAYASGHFSGNLLDLTEPSYSEHFRPHVLSNGSLSKDYWHRRTACGGVCTRCGWCRDAQKDALVDVSDWGAVLLDSSNAQQGEAGNADK